MTEQCEGQLQLFDPRLLDDMTSRAEISRADAEAALNEWRDWSVKGLTSGEEGGWSE